MRRRTHYSILVALAAFGIFLLVAMFVGHHRDDGVNPPTSLIEYLERPDSFRVGNSNAKVTVVIFFDPVDSSSTQFFVTLKKLARELGDRVSWIYRYNAISDDSIFAACVLEETRLKGNYLQALELMLLYQEKWALKDGVRADQLMELLGPIAKPEENYRWERVTHKNELKVLRDQNDAAQFAGSAQPAIFVNGKSLGLLGHTSIRSALLDALAQKGASEPVEL